MQTRIDADRGERFQIEVLQVRRRRLQDHLKLVVVLQPVGIFAVAAVLRPPRRLHIGRIPWPRAKRAQGGRGMEGAGAHFHVVGLQDHAAVIGPITLQRQDQSLERAFRAHMRGRESIVGSGLRVRGGRGARDRIGGDRSRNQGEARKPGAEPCEIGRALARAIGAGDGVAPQRRNLPDRAASATRARRASSNSWLTLTAVR